MKMGWFSLIVFGALGVVQSAQAGMLMPPQPVQARVLGFELASGRDCSQMLHPLKDCQEMEPKPWTEAEINQMRVLLEPVLAVPLFVERITLGQFQILRYASGPGSGWVFHKDHSINIADSLVDRPYPRDSYSGFDTQRQVVLHELAHAFDSLEHLAYLPEFLELAGWRLVNGEYRLNRGASESDVKQVVAEMTRLIQERRMEESYHLNREFGLRYGMPTAYSMTSPNECFAEIVSHVFYDPLVSTYLSAELIEWVRDRVLR